jgi:hypothetical protein
MLAFLFLLAATLAGIAGICLLACKALSAGENIFAGVVVGWTFATIGAYVSARSAGELTRDLMLRVTIASSVVAIGLCWLAWKRRRGLGWREQSWWAGLPVLLFAPIYAALFHTRMFYEQPDGIHSGGTSFYDMPFHAAITTSFLYARNFPPVYMLFPPEPLLYPCLPDFLTAAVVASGVDLHLALCLTGVTLATAVTGLVYCFASQLIVSPHKSAAAALATVLCLLNGGLALTSRQLAEYKVRWTNVIVDAFLPQRTGLFGCAIALTVFTIFAAVWRAWTNERARNEAATWKLLLGAGLLTGSLPFFHPHSFLAVAIVSTFLFLLKPRTAWLAFAAPAVLIPLPLLLRLGQHMRGLGQIRFDPGWFGHGNSNWLMAWLLNAGLPGLLLVPAWLAASPSWRRFYFAFVALAVVSLLVVFSPNEVDNFKLLFYWQAATCVLIAQWLVSLANRQRWGQVVASLLALGCVATGVHALWAEHRDQKIMFNRAQADAAAFIRTQAATDALFLTAPSFHQPVVSLAGRRVLRANTTWLWSHGYDFRAREADVGRIYAGTSDAAELLRYYDIDYVYLDENARHQLRAKEGFFDARFPVVYLRDGLKIYDTREAQRKVGGRSHMPAPREYASRIGKDPAVLLTAFPQVSYFLYRTYKTSLGREPRYDEFMRDLKLLGRGVYVSAPGWEQILDANKHLLAEKSGAAVSNAPFDREQYDAAWIVMHYFGYLRRNPDDPPDNDMNGYGYWLAYLRRTHDYSGLSRAFLESTEYQSRPVEDFP